MEVVRTQIQLTEIQSRELKREARRLGVSMAEVIRRYVEAGLERESAPPEKLYERARSLIGRFADTEEAVDVAREHDRYLDETLP